MTRTRRHGRDKWKESLPLTPQAWEEDDVRQRLVDWALDLKRPNEERRVAALAANELEYLRERAQ